MAKLIMMKGLPGSGKSTKAKELLKEMGNAVRVNKDLLRTMLHFDHFTGKNEGITVDTEKKIAAHFLVNDINVIVDDTNLRPDDAEKWKRLAFECVSSFEVREMDTPIEECIIRDSMRDGKAHVGSFTIKNMALRNNIYRPEGKFVLFDFDGTIADCSHRRHFVQTKPKDWKSFFEAAKDDPPRLEVIEMMRAFEADGFNIIIVTARPEDYKKMTMKWLVENGIHPYTMIMRRSGDGREDSIVKKEILHTYFPDKSKIEYVVDDRPRVIRMWQEEGLDVIDVGNGEEF